MDYSAEELAAGKAATLALVGPHAELVSPYPFKLPDDKQRAPEGALTQAETEQLCNLKAAISAARARGSWSPGQTVEAEAHMDDFTLLRFCKSRPDSAEEALVMFEDAMQWRHERGTSALFAELHKLGPPTARHACSRENFYAGFGGFAKDGSPFFIERMGIADLSGFASEPKVLDLMYDSYVCYLEQVFRSVRNHAAAVGSFSRILIVVDASQLGFSTMRNIGIIKAVSKIGPCETKQPP